MSNFGVIQDYVTTAMFVLMPVAGMMLICYSGYALWRDLRGAERRKLLERLREDDLRRQAKKIEQSIAKQGKDAGLFDVFLQRVSLARKIDRWIEQADLNITASRFIVGVGTAIVAVAALTLIIQCSIWTVLILCGLTAYLPVFVLGFLARRRMNKLVNQLPDVFELISQALRAGHSLASGVQLIGKQLPNPAGIEFARIFHEQNLGIKIEEAMTNFANRTDQLDIRFFVTAVLIQRQTGGDLAEILDKIADVIKDRLKIMGQVQALTAEGRMSGWVLGIMPFVVFLLAWCLNPDYANVLLHETKGQYMLGGGLFFQVLGMLMIKKIVNIKI